MDKKQPNDAPSAEELAEQIIAGKFGRPPVADQEAPATPAELLQHLVCKDLPWPLPDTLRNTSFMITVDAEGSLTVGAAVAAISDAPTAEDLAEENGGHWGEYLEHPVGYWQIEVANDETRLGYWKWVASKLEQRKNEADDESEG